MQHFMIKRLLWVGAAALALAAGLFLACFHSPAPSRQTATGPSVAAAAATGAVNVKSTGAPGLSPSARPAQAGESDLAVNPYAGALREPGKSKRAWDPEFIKQFRNAASNAPIQFELTAPTLLNVADGSAPTHLLIAGVIAGANSLTLG
jgi:hypothetical protein